MMTVQYIAPYGVQYTTVLVKFIYCTVRSKSNASDILQVEGLLQQNNF